MLSATRLVFSVVLFGIATLLVGSAANAATNPMVDYTSIHTVGVVIAVVLVLILLVANRGLPVTD